MPHNYTPAELEAVWTYVHTLQSRYQLPESDAIDRALSELDTAGKPLTIEHLRKHHPLKRGPDTHTDDIGRELLERGLDWSPPAEDTDAQQWADHHLAQLAHHPEALSALRERIGTTVISALFRRVLPELPQRQWTSQRSSKTLEVGYFILCPRPLNARGDLRACDTADMPESFLIGRSTDGILISDHHGQIHACRKGAIGIFDSNGLIIDVILEATLRRRPRVLPYGRPVFEFDQYSRTGLGDWEYSFKKFVTYASLYSPGETNALTGAGIAALFGETRAAISARKQKELADYRRDTGGRAGFAGMRTTPDPRKGKKKPLKKSA